MKGNYIVAQTNGIFCGAVRGGSCGADEQGTVYLLCFDRPYRHARHYLGWASNLERRLADHSQGRGARLLQVIQSSAAGDEPIGWTVVRTWKGPRCLERKLKRQHSGVRLCPICGRKGR